MAVVFEQVQFSFPVIENFLKKHPYQLTDTLGVAIHADIFAHDVLYGFNDAGNITHADSSFLI
jgi:hypothetical protein